MFTIIGTFIWEISSKKSQKNYSLVHLFLPLLERCTCDKQLDFELLQKKETILCICFEQFLIFIWLFQCIMRLTTPFALVWESRMFPQGMCFGYYVIFSSSSAARKKKNNCLLLLLLLLHETNEMNNENKNNIHYNT